MGASISARAGIVKEPALLLCLLIAGVGLPVFAGVAVGEELQCFPVEASGDIHFHLDGAVFLEPDLHAEAYFYLAVSEEEFVCVTIEGRPGYWIQLGASLAFLDGEGREMLRLGTGLDIACTRRETGAAFTRRVVRLQAPLQPGTRGVEVELRDQNAKRAGLIYQMRSEMKHGIARGRLEPSQIRNGRGLGGPLFLWDFDEDGSLARAGGFVVGSADSLRARIDPNPARIYGLFKPIVGFYLEAYGQEGGELSLVLRVRSLPDSAVLTEETSRIRSHWQRCGLARSLDVSRLPAGSYILELDAHFLDAAEVPAEVTAPVVRIARKFEMLWDADSWGRLQIERREEAALILDEQTWRRFMTLPCGQQEALLESVWVALGGAPGSQGVASLKAKFRERVEIATARYRSPLRRGLSDRGRVFVHFGEPDEVHKEVNPQDNDQLYYFLRREIGEAEAAEVGGRPRRHPFDTSAYEVWYYMNGGDSILDDGRSPGQRGMLRFIFADDMGAGDYRLIYCNLFGGFGRGR